MTTTKSKTTKTTDEAAKTYENVMSAGKQSVETATKAYDDFMSLSRENVEALIASGNAAAKGVEEINAEVLAYNKVAFEDSMAAAKAVMSAKSVQDAFDLQTEWVKASFDSYMAQATKVGEMAAKASQAAFQPMNDRVAVMVEKAIKPVSL
jgi:phasin family protein